ncbi:MAG: ATP-dependent endonuclease [Magnetococcales bacterium]|nr:ATP-dependent endonuclease [Magnetococcales bacterium]
MIIKSVIVNGYKSLNVANIKFEKFTRILGPNNSGKSNLISAIEFFVSTKTKPSPQDVFVNHKHKSPIWVEIVFSHLTADEKDTFKKYVRNDGSIKIRKTATLSVEGAKVSYNGYISEPAEKYLKESEAKNLTDREEIKKTPLQNLVPEKGKLTKKKILEAQEQYIQNNHNDIEFIESIESGPFMGQMNVAGGLLPELIIIPAIRDLSEETKIKATTSFGRLLTRTIKEMTENNKKFQDIRNQLDGLVRSLNSREDDGESEEEEFANELIELEKALASELIDWNVKAQIKINPPEIEKIFELASELHLDDGLSTPADRKGHGLQRAVIFALLRAWSNTLRNASEKQKLKKGASQKRSASESVIFAMEEPEIFLHPQAQKRLAKSLQEISKTDGHQVIISTHSPSFVNLDFYKEIIIVSKEYGEVESKIRQCTKDLFEGDSHQGRKNNFNMVHWVNPDRSEMFFARKVVFVEGITEKVVIPFVAERIGLFDPSISIIDCGSKFNLPIYTEIANSFDFEYFVVHDQDPLPETWPDNWNEDKRKSKKRTYELNAEIADRVNGHNGNVIMFSPDFEGNIGVSKNQGEKKGKALAALDFLKDLDPESIPDNLLYLIDYVKKIYKPVQPEQKMTTLPG